jgi:hypothetical protein
MPRSTPVQHRWLAVLAMALLLGLLLLATHSSSQTPLGTLGVFAFSLFISLGFLLFGRQSFPRAEQDQPSDPEQQA